MNILNNKGPNIDPWGTPHSIFDHLLSVSLIVSGNIYFVMSISNLVFLPIFSSITNGIK